MERSRIRKGILRCLYSSHHLKAQVFKHYLDLNATYLMNFKSWVVIFFAALAIALPGSLKVLALLSMYLTSQTSAEILLKMKEQHTFNTKLKSLTAKILSQ